MRLSFALCTLFLLLFVSLNFAQVFRFNGQFNDPSGQSVSGTTFVSSVMVQLFDSPVVGQSGYIQMEPSVQVVDGLFSLDIGPGLPDLNQYRYLELTISGETLSPRVPILVAPLSLQSMDSERFGKLTTDEFLQIVGNAILEESNFITDSLTTGLSILSNDIVNNSQQIGSLDGRLSTVEQNAGSNAALQAVSQSLQSQDLRLQDLELVVGDSQSQLQALSSQLGVLGSEQALQSADLSSVQSDVLALDSSLAQLQTTVSFLQGNLSQTPLDVLTSGAGSFATSASLNFVGSDLQLVIYSVLTDENAADKILLFDSDGLEAFRVNAGGEVTATAYYGDGSGLDNLSSSQITDFVTAVENVVGGPLSSSDVTDFSTAVDTQLQVALGTANFSSTQISDFVTATESVVTGASLFSSQISDFSTAVDAQIAGANLSSVQITDLSTAIDSQISGASLNSAQITDLSTAIDSQFSGATFTAAQVSDFDTSVDTRIGSANLNSSQISDFVTAVDSQVTGATLSASQVSDFDTSVDARIGVANINSSQVSDFVTAVDSQIIGATLSSSQVSDFDSSVDSRIGVATINSSQVSDFVTAVDSQINGASLSSSQISDFSSAVNSAVVITRGDLGLASVQDVDVTTSFVQNPSAYVGTHKIRGIDSQGLHLVNQYLDGVHISDSNGFMAINTYNPISALEVYGDDTFPQSSIISLRRATHSGAAGIQFYNEVVNAGVAMGLGGGGYTQAPGKFFLKEATGPNVHMVVESNGAIGINTVNPAARLDVAGALRLQTRTSTTGFDGTIRWNGSDLEVKQYGSWTSLTGGGGSSVFTNNTTNAVYDAGFLGLGAAATNPDEQLLVDGRIRLKNNNDNAGQDGTIRWTGSDLEVKNAGQWYSLTSGGSSTSAGGGSTNAFDDYALIIDKRAAGVHGGAAASGYTTRTLNTVVRDDGNIVQMTGDAFTLQPGSYEINADAPSNSTLYHVLVLVDHDTEQIIATGTAEFSQNNHSQTRSFLSTTMDLATTRTFELRHWANTANPTTGLGVSTNFGGDEVYTRLQIWKEDGYSEGGSSGSSNFADSGGNTNLTTGFLGINEPSPVEALDVAGRMRLQTTTGDAGQDGTIRWTGSDLEVKNAGSWLSLTSGGSTTGTTGTGDDYILIADVVSQGSGGGTNVVGGWQTRDLNTIVEDDGGVVVSLSTNQFTLPPGTYQVRASAPAYRVAFHKIELMNSGTGLPVATGTSEYVSNTDLVQTRSSLSTKFTITTNTAYHIRHYTAQQQANNGLGVDTAEGTNMYTVVEIIREGMDFGGGGSSSNFADSGPNTNLTTGFLGINEPNPAEALDVAGRLRIQTSTDNAGLDGTVRWTGSDLEVKNAGSWLSLTSGVNTTNTSFSAIDYALILDEKASGSLSGSAVASIWNIRTLNTIKSDEKGIVKDLTGNVVTLDPGSYKIRAMSQGLYIDQHRLRLYDTASATPIATGNSGWAQFGLNTFNHVEVNTFQTFSTTATIRLEHYATTAQGSNAFGQANSIAGSPEVFAYFEIWKFNDFNAAVAQAAGESTEIKDADNDTLIDTASGGDSDKIIFQTDGTLGMVITSDNRVGIGTDQTQGGALTIQSQSTNTNILMNTTQPNYITGFDLYNGNAPKWALHSRGTADGANLDDRFSIQNGSASEVMTLHQTGSVGIGTNTPKYHLDIRHPSGYTLARIDTVSGSNLSALFFSTGGNDDWHISARGAADAPTGRLSIYDQSNYEAMSFLQGGKVGISKTNPTTALHVGGGVTAEGGLTVGFAADPVDGLIQLGDANHFWKFNGGVNPHMAWDANDYWGYDRVANDYFWYSNGTEKMRILGDGKVGIGTSSPAELLHVKNASGHAQATIEGGSGAFGSTLEFKNNGASKWLLQSRGTIDGPNDRFTIHNAGAASQVFTILQTGSLGLGTSSPNHRLHIVNDTAPIIQVGNSTGVDGALYLGNNNHGVKRAFNGTPGTNDVGLYTLNGGIALSTNGEGTIGEFYMNDSGNIGIGTSNPQNLLHVTGDVSLETGLTVGFVGTPSTDTLYVGDPNFHLAYSSGTNPYLAFDSFDTFGFIRASDTFSWAVGGTELMKLDSAGQLGIGTAAPSEKLEVNGNIKTTGSVIFPNGSQTQPYVAKSAFHVHMNSVNQTISSGVVTLVNWATEEFDIGANFDPATDTFTAPVAGIYHFNATFTYTTAGADTYTAITLYKNAVSYKNVDCATNAAAQGSCVLSITVNLAANDTISVNAWHNMGVSKDLIGDPFRTFFSGHLVTPTN